MMRIRHRRLIRLLFIYLLGLCLSIQLLCNARPIYASQPLDIVVIGDSIAKGVGSSDPETKSFGACLSDKFQGNLTNLGISGLDSSQLKEKLQTEKFKKALSKADVIFISIGSNDLLKPFISIVSDGIGADTKNKDVYKALQDRFRELSKKSVLIAASALSSVVHDLNDNKTLNQACAKFPDNFNSIINELKENYPEAVIYVNNIYNPYYGVAYDLNGVSILNIYQLCEGYIQKLNLAFARDEKNYILMDMYNIFKQEGYTNVRKGSISNMSKASFDPHPNDDGYQLMADYIYTRMDSVAPSATLEESQNGIALSKENIVIQFSESVRAVKGKRILIKNKTQSFTYTIPENKWVTADENGNFTLSIPLSEWKGNSSSEQLNYATEYELTTQPGTFKDKGNNSLKEEKIGTFKTGEHPQGESVQTMSNAQKFKENSNKFILFGITGVLFVAVITIVLVIRRKRNRLK